MQTITTLTPSQTGDQQSTRYYNVRYGKMAFVMPFKSNVEISRGASCIVKTDKGTEWGVVLNMAVSSTNPDFRIIREATSDDIKRKIQIEEIYRPEEFTFCKDQIKNLNLEMKLVDVDHLFGDERIVFYFHSQTRVDFRELVKLLIKRFTTQIELRQVGARDTTRITGGKGSCGRTLCCSTWKKDLGGITYEMAQTQFDNPEQQMLLGACGKLKCCLKYEYEDYVKILRLLPAVGSRIKSGNIEGIVVSRNPGQGIVVVEDVNGNRQTLAQDAFVGEQNPPPPTPTQQNINEQ